MSFVKCPSCEKTVFLKDSGQCPYCGATLEAESAPQPQASGDNRDTEFPQRSKLSCLVAGIAAAVALIGAVAFVIAAARG
ncbi:MAG: hypothetical protein R6V62_10625 [Candidatus Fermentibacteraceae bacterium]